MAHQIYIIGCGPGSPDCLTNEAVKTVGKCVSLVGSQRLLLMFPWFTGAKTAIGSDMNSAVRIIEDAHEKGIVGVLVSGDPGLFSLARLVKNRFGFDMCKYVPGISSLQVAFSRVGLDWSDARIISSHGQDPDPDVVSSLYSESKIAVFLGRTESMSWVRSFLKGHPREVKCLLFENLTLEDENIREIEAGFMTEIKVSSRSLLLVMDKGLLE
ncbi:MAG: precorrin-6y C5,15-methyltransferase (decarboxylating) subunit CbiE [Pseudomonadota bacterium]